MLERRKRSTRESQDYHLCHWHHHDSEAVDQVGGCIGGTDGRTRGRNLKRSKGILLIPAAVSVGNLGDEDGDGDDDEYCDCDVDDDDCDDGDEGDGEDDGESKEF